MDPLRVHSRLVIPPEELRAEFVRSGGPGGQNVNRRSTQVILRFDVRGSRALGDARRARIERALAHRLTAAGEIVVRASRHREQRRNLEDARERLAALLAEALRPPRPRKPTRPTRASKERRLAEKRRRSEVKRRRSGGEGP